MVGYRPAGQQGSSFALLDSFFLPKKIPPPLSFCVQQETLFIRRFNVVSYEICGLAFALHNNNVGLMKLMGA